MPHRLLIIEQPSLAVEDNLGPLLTPEAGFLCERVNWESFRAERLRDCMAHLIVTVAVPQPAQAMRFFQWLRSHPIALPIFAVLPADSADEVLRTASETAEDFILWPSRKEEFRQRLVRILGAEKDDLDSVELRLLGEMGFAQLVGRAPAFLRTLEKIPIMAASDAPVLLSGETGTGKELCARAIHHLSKRRTRPFIPVDCGALPDQLFENEVFGHARGAFTDAHADQKGLAAMADGGTLFLDEIDALSPCAQAKLLRFLQERTYKPLGGGAVFPGGRQRDVGHKP